MEKSIPHPFHARRAGDMRELKLDMGLKMKMKMTIESEGSVEME